MSLTPTVGTGPPSTADNVSLSMITIGPLHSGQRQSPFQSEAGDTSSGLVEVPGSRSSHRQALRLTFTIKRDSSRSA